MCYFLTGVYTPFIISLLVILVNVWSNRYRKKV